MMRRKGEPWPDSSAFCNELARCGVAGDDVAVRVNLPRYRSVPEVPHAHVFVKGAAAQLDLVELGSRGTASAMPQCSPERPFGAHGGERHAVQAEGKGENPDEHDMSSEGSSALREDFSACEVTRSWACVCPMCGEDFEVSQTGGTRFLSECIAAPGADGCVCGPCGGQR